MLDVMFEIPGQDQITGCVMTKEAIDGEEKPKLIYDQALICPEKRSKAKQEESPLEETA